MWRQVSPNPALPIRPGGDIQTARLEYEKRADRAEKIFG